MILLFPDLDTLRLCVTGNVVAPDVVLAPAAASFDDQNRIYVEPSVGLSKTTMKDLDRLGVKGSKRHATDVPEPVASWLQLFPATRGAAPPVLSSQATVLFELESADDLPVLVTEMLRLGNDRQSFRWFAAPDAPDGRRALLRVIGPPYYTLLRALDRTASGTAQPVRAYVERAPRVWVEIGHDHPFAAQVRVADQQAVLIRPPRTWTFLDEAPFRDVYDILQFRLPTGPVVWAATEAVEKMAVPLRLTAGAGTDEAELWVLRDDGVAQLDALVRDAEDQLTQRLMFAVAIEPAGRQTVVLRTRPSKLPPPVLPLERAVAFRPFSKLPNLFVPAGRRLHPTLRRDAVRRLLADDPDRVVWLYPDGDNGFVPETVPDAAFRALDEWVEYVIESERLPLAAWIGATRFDFDHFVCTDAGGPKPRPDKEPKAGDEESPKSAKGLTPQAKPGGKGKVPPRPTAPAEYQHTGEARPPSEWKVRREELERQFIGVDGPLDAPDRVSLWPELARVNAGLGETSDAAACWLNAIWTAGSPPMEWYWGWLQAEKSRAEEGVRPDEFDRRLRQPTPAVADVRGLVAAFLWTAHQHPLPSWLGPRLPAVQSYLEANEKVLPVRAVWLTGYRLAQLSGADVLGLARVRDRVLQRLLTEGLSPERDLPGFLRYAGLRDADRLRAARERALDLYQAIARWTAPVAQNLPYVDLMFAFALAKLGERTRATELVAAARDALVMPLPASMTDQTQLNMYVGLIANNVLFRGFEFRINEAVAGRPHTGPLSHEVDAAVQAVAQKGKQKEYALQGISGQSNNPYWLAEYVIRRMQKESRVLEPQMPLDPYEEVMRDGDPLKAQLAEIHALRDPAKAVDRIRRVYAAGVKGKHLDETRFTLLHATLPISARLGEAFAAELLAHVPGALAARGGATGAGPEPSDRTRKRGELLERALFIAAHFDHRDTVRQLTDRFGDLIHGQSDEVRYESVNVVAGQCLRSLKKLGMRDEIDGLLGRMRHEVLGGATIGDLQARHSSRPEVYYKGLQAITNLASAWLVFGRADQALPTLDAVRDVLLGPRAATAPAQRYAELALAYLNAVTQAGPDRAFDRMLDFFANVDRGAVRNTYTTAHYYSRFHLSLVEATVFALVSDEFAFGPTGRRWLDDDEYLVRRRVHADMKRHLERSGL